MNSADFKTNSFNWDEVKKRLARVQLALQGDRRFSDQQIDQLMKDRAEQLAKVPDEAPDSEQLLEVIRFQVGGEKAAIEARWIRGITTLESLTRIPESDPFFLGVTNLRGEITAVIDLAAFLGLASPKNLDELVDRETIEGSDSRTSIQAMVLGTEQPDCALLVDGFQEVTTIAQDQILEPLASSGILAEITLGCTSEPILILDGKALLACEKLTIDQSER